ncbi:MAG: HAD family phosphatase [Alphaproteobacteria bacterium]|nr:MAG: HAD family phosphatase [Alphaproteobacteria bacterium]
MSRKIKAICWDVDGTLVDTEPLYQETLRAVAREHGIHVPKGIPLEGIGARTWWGWLTQNCGLAVPVEDFMQECAAHYMSHPELIVPRAGAGDAFRYFDALSLPQCAVSGGVRDQVDANLDRSGVASDMLFSIAADDVEKSKPDPDPYLLAKAVMCKMQGWENKPEENACFLAIEDSAAGIGSAKRAGFTAIFWSPSPGETFPGADYNVHTPQELLDLCRTLVAPPAPASKPAPKGPRSP